MAVRSSRDPTSAASVYEGNAGADMGPLDRARFAVVLNRIPAIFHRPESRTRDTGLRIEGTRNPGIALRTRTDPHTETTGREAL